MMRQQLRAALMAALLIVTHGWNPSDAGANPGEARNAKSPAVTEAKAIKAFTVEFAVAKDIGQKLAAVRKLSASCRDSAVPPEARYLLALDLLRKHLTWHVRAMSEQQDREMLRGQIVRLERDNAQSRWRWDNAHTGEPWMLAALPADQANALRQAKKALAKALRQDDRADRIKCYWRIRDDKHADVARAKKLLASLDTFQARRWLAEIERNNTAVTLDICGGYALRKSGPVVIDVRNAETVTLKLYRVRSAQELVSVSDRIGTDYMYRDYGLQHEQQQALDFAKDLLERARMVFTDREKHPLPWSPAAGNIVRKWRVKVADLKKVHQYMGRFRHQWYDDMDDDEGRYFDDVCSRYERRISKSYRGEGPSDSAWVCDRIVRIPGPALGQAGAYVLLAEANGQQAIAPIVVEPLSLTMRRCRDGVFVVVSTPDGSKGIEGAKIHAWQMLNRPTTNADGAAFAKVTAMGHRAVIAEHDGRYAIGGFGKLFEGLYLTYERRMMDERDMASRPFERLQRAVQAEKAGVYSDRTILAAYTDRPAYRPGQRVQFKLIARRAANVPWSPDAPDLGDAFRAEDFDAPMALSVPPAGTTLTYDVINPRARAIAAGTLKLNDYGTAVGKATLLDEAALGRYALRVTVNGRRRIVPDVFIVKAFRRANFVLTASGVPTRLSQAAPIKLAVAGEYYFGKPLTGGAVEARLVRRDHWRVRGRAANTLDANGKASLSLPVPPDLPAGDYAVICTLTDATGRTVSKSLSCRIDLPRSPASLSSISALPRFVPLGEAIAIETASKAVTAVQWYNHGSKKRELSFPANAKGRSTLKFTHAGWYALADGKAGARLFVYGGDDLPESTQCEPTIKRAPDDGGRNQPPPPATGNQDNDEPRWISLTRYMGENGKDDLDGYNRNWDSRWDDRDDEVWALFDGRHAEVGGVLRVLLYTPTHRKARVLLTLEGRTVADYRIVATGRKDPNSSFTVVELPITPRCLPNFYLRGRTLYSPGRRARQLAARKERRDRAIELEPLRQADATEDPRWCRIDVLDPRHVDHERLKVAIQTDRKQYRPGQKVDVTMRVTDMAGKPRQAEVSLGAVDEGIYTFGTGNLSPLAGAFTQIAPPRRYRRKKWRSYRSLQWSADRPPMAERAHLQTIQKLQDSLQDLAKAIQQAQAPALAAPPGATAGQIARRRERLAQLGEMPVGSLASARMRIDFRATAAWMPQLRTDPAGLAKAAFTLPDSLTAYRLSAVALTKETQIGTGRAGLTVALPLSAQLFLPRFAVENDRFDAVALIHNNSARPKTCDVAWDVTGATVKTAGANVQAAKVRKTAGKTLVTGKVAVPARASARVSLSVLTDTVGQATFAFRAGAGSDVDAEQRHLAVHALGREQRVAINGRFQGRRAFALPAGFTADKLAVTLARSETLAALDGLGYLVTYPYGCVEQTMSRFLPAVMVQHAVDRVAVALPADVHRNLPHVLAGGLARLYNFQHADGGWGWWEGDKTNDRMTVYVVYGLARCKLGGTKVDSDVLRRGCEYLRKRLAVEASHAKDMPGPLSDDLKARAHLALALAGRTDRTLLARDGGAADEGKMSMQARCNLALAYHATGLAKPARRLWRGAAGWKPTTTSDVALKLMTQAAMAAPPAQRRENVAALLARKTGHRWRSTCATSWAIEALTNELSAVAAADNAAGLKVRIDGRDVVAVKDSDGRQKLVRRFHAAPADLPRKEALTVELLADCDGPVRFSLTAIGTQQLDKAEPIGQAVKMTRRYATAAGKPLGPSVQVGRTVAVHVTVELAKPQRYMMVEDRRPTGLEFAHDRLFGPAAAAAAHVEFRDDRLCVFFTDLPAGKHELVYYLRAETPWTGHVLPGAAYPMYNETTRGETSAAKLTVTP